MTTGRFQYHAPPAAPKGFFILLPSQSRTLLLKAVAVNELMLPCDLQTNTEQPSQEKMAAVSASMDQVISGLEKKLFVSCNPTLARFYSKKSLPTPKQCKTCIKHTFLTKRKFFTDLPALFFGQLQETNNFFF